jgi:predicted Zn-dependent protease
MLAALGHAYATAQKTNEANKTLDKLEELSRQQYVSPMEVAAIYTALGNSEQAFKLLKEARAEHSFHLVYVNVSPQFKVLRSDPRFQALVHSIGLSP